MEKATVVDFGGIGVDAYRAALAQTVIVDNLRLRQTGGMDETIKFLVALHHVIIEDYGTHDLHGGIMMHSVLREAYFAYLAQQTEILGQPFFQSYGCYTQLNHKSANLTIRDIFLKQLLNIKQLSIDKATAIIQKFSTFASLYHHYDDMKTDDKEKFFKDWTAGSSRRKFGPILSKRICNLFNAHSYPNEIDFR